MKRAFVLVVIFSICFLLAGKQVVLDSETLAWSGHESSGVKIALSKEDLQSYEFGFTEATTISAATPVPTLEFNPTVQTSENGPVIHAEPVYVRAYWKVLGWQPFHLELSMSGPLSAEEDSTESSSTAEQRRSTIDWTFTNLENNETVSSTEIGKSIKIMERTADSDSIYDQNVARLKLEVGDIPMIGDSNSSQVQYKEYSASIILTAVIP